MRCDATDAGLKGRPLTEKGNSRLLGCGDRTRQGRPSAGPEHLSSGRKTQQKATQGLQRPRDPETQRPGTGGGEVRRKRSGTPARQSRAAPPGDSVCRIIIIDAHTVPGTRNKHCARPQTPGPGHPFISVISVEEPREQGLARCALA